MKAADINKRIRHGLGYRMGGKSLSEALINERAVITELAVSIVQTKTNEHIAMHYSRNNVADDWVWNTIVHNAIPLAGVLDMGEFIHADKPKQHEDLTLIDFFILGDPAAVRLEWWEDRRRTGQTPMQVMYVTAGQFNRVMSTKNPHKARKVFNALVADMQAKLISQGNIGDVHKLDTDGEEI